MRKNSRHMEVHWEEEMKVIRECVNEGDVLSNHILNQMQERDISVSDLALVLLTGKVIEGFDTGMYPGYRNPQMIRNVVGKDTRGRYINVGVAISNKLQSISVELLTTVYELNESKYYSRAM